MRAAQFVTKHPINVSEVCWKLEGGEDACLQASWECPAGVSILHSPCGHPLERPLKRPVILWACWSAVVHFTVGSRAEWESFSCFKCSKIGRRVGAGQWSPMPVLRQWEICARRLLSNHRLYIICRWPRSQKGI